MPRPIALSLFAAPRFFASICAAVRRHFLVWRKYLFERVLSNIVEPLMTLVAFGYGLGALCRTSTGQVPALPGHWNHLRERDVLGQVRIAVGRLQSDGGAKTWAGVMNTPLSVDDILFGDSCGPPPSPCSPGSACC